MGPHSNNCHAVLSVQVDSTIHNIHHYNKAIDRNITIYAYRHQMLYFDSVVEAHNLQMTGLCDMLSFNSESSNMCYK
jgi:hypothetical protein